MQAHKTTYPTYWRWSQAAVDQAMLANSITLTPGTLTLDADDGKLLVHALTADGATALEQGEMLRRVAAIHED